MLEPGIIPNSEPIIRVGIILPEDEQKKLYLESDNEIKIILNDSSDITAKGQIEIRVEDDLLLIKNNKTSNCRIIIEENKSIEIGPVIAGRNFHWKKKIKIQLPHIVDFSIKDGNLLIVNELPLEQYIACVATSEMSASCPESFIQSQTIVARSWMLANIEQKHRQLGFDVCNDDCCQRYQGNKNLTANVWEASMKCRGKILMYGGNICDARYSKSCGGVMERFENLWIGKPLPYMENKVDAFDISFPDLRIEKEFKKWMDNSPMTFCSPYFIKEDELTKYLGTVDESGKYFRWEVEISQKELLANFNEKSGLRARAIIQMEVLSRAGSGRMLDLDIHYLDSKDRHQVARIEKDYRVREILHPNFLYSSACSILKIDNGTAYPDFKYKGGGWGHGAGLCQIGALGMSLQNYDYEKILAHYYPGSKIIDIYK